MKTDLSAVLKVNFIQLCPITQASQAQGEEPEANQNQPEPAKKKISYAQLVKEGRRFNIDLVSKVTHHHNRTAAVMRRYG